MPDTRPQNAAVALRDTPLSLETDNGTPTRPQPLGSDQFDFATRPSSLRSQHGPENEGPTSTGERISHSTSGFRPQHLTVQVPQSPGPVSPRTTLSDILEPSSAGPSGKNVQFGQEEEIIPDPTPSHSHSRTGSWDTREALGKFRGSGLMAKLKELAGPISTPSQPPRTPVGGSEFPSTASSPTTSRHPTRHEGSDDDADAEETADETTAGHPNKGKQKKKRRMRRYRVNDHSSLPNTPGGPGAVETPTSANASGHNVANSSPHGPLSFLRRTTFAGFDDHGFSEGEGRDRLFRERLARRAAAHGLSISRMGTDADDADGPSSSRMGYHFRRFSALGGGGGGGGGEIGRAHV